MNAFVGSLSVSRSLWSKPKISRSSHGSFAISSFVFTLPTTRSAHPTVILATPICKKTARWETEEGNYAHHKHQQQFCCAWTLLLSWCNLGLGRGRARVVGCHIDWLGGPSLCISVSSWMPTTNMKWLGYLEDGDSLLDDIDSRVLTGLS
jgi:hypothetical protein